jgi:hypothetical protein
MKIFCFIFLSFFFAGCDLFNVRNAQPPSQPRSDYQLAVTPDILIQNLQSSLADKNTENYMASFANPTFTTKKFIFSPTASAVSQFPSLAEGWGLSNEQQYFNNLITKVDVNSPITLTLSDISSSSYGDSLVYSASYFLNVPSNTSNLPSNYQGQLTFNMVRDSRAVWVIYYWQDTKNSSLPGWSELKGRLY